MSRTVWLAGAAAILPLATLCAAEASPAPRAFVPPQAAQILTRTLRHVLHDGAAVVTRRSYRVQFVAEDAGFRLDGTLVDVAVEAPPGPATDAIAALERRRPDAGMFPIRLDAAGMILPAPDPAPTAQQREGIGVASAEVRRMNLAAGDKTAAQGFVSQFRSQPYRTSWPQDLFRPAPGARREERLIPLANGVRGQVTTDIEARTDAATGLLAAFRRKITTDLEGNTRVVIEEWTLSPAP